MKFGGFYLPIPRSARAIATLVVLAAVIATFAMHAATEPKQGAKPVLIELFTSHGCSSCPPADELLRELARDPKLRGRVIPLAFHVDYWDYLGWRDPFSSKQWTLRQMRYVRAMQLQSAYTPQLVVDGRQQLVGSNASAVRAAIAAASNQKSDSDVRIAIMNNAATISGNAPAGLELVLAIYEDDITTKVTRGENAGRSIANDAIVRGLAVVSTTDGKAFTHNVPLQLDPSWNRAHLGVVALLQERDTMRVHAVAATTAASRP